MPRVLQKSTHQKQVLQKIIFSLATAAFILTIGFSIYVLCRGRFPTVPMGRVTNPPLRKIISPTPSSSPIPPISPTAHVISYVHDGDTIYAKNIRVGIRLIGIDAPEMAGSYRCGVDANCTATTEQCGATAAKEKLMELVLNHEVWLVEDNTTGLTDKYNRLLRYVFVRRGEPLSGSPHGAGYKPAPTKVNEIPCVTENESCLDIDLEMIRLGLARESGFGNSYEKQKIYQQVETEAKTKKMGIWGKCR